MNHMKMVSFSLCKISVLITMSVLIKDGIKHTTNQAKGNVLINQHFSTAFTHDKGSTLPNMGPSSYPCLPDLI